VVFDRGRYAPDSADGRRLLAHELAHVVQQRGGGAVPSRLEIGCADDPAEAEADRIAERAGAAWALSAQVRLQRAPPRFGDSCNEFHRCSVLEPLIHAKQLVDAAVAAVGPVAAGTV